MNRPYRIAFNLNLDGQWTGGVSYYENLFRALAYLKDSRNFKLLGFYSEYQPFLDSLTDKLDELYQVVDSGSGSQNVLKRILLKNSRFFRLEPVLSKHMRERDVDIAFLRGDPGINYKVQVLSWFPDFQYFHLPEMFSGEERYILDRTIKDIGRYSARVILSSEAAKNDFLQIVPEFADKARVLSFVSFVDDMVYKQDVRGVCDKYHLPERFFLLPNQFWKHKNHKMVLDALKLAHRVSPDIKIVSTGLLADYRNPTYSSEFLAEISRSGVRDSFIMLGVLPRSDLYAIMRQSLAVIQPSLFEGWSTIVEEVKSLGKMIIVSDLPVHREQNPPMAEYFNPLDANELAGKMLLVYDKKQPGPDLDLEDAARRSFPLRSRSFGETFLSIVEDVLKQR